jgi:uncharacterized membrane protein
MNIQSPIEKEIHTVFDITLFLKALHACIEVAGGFVLFFISKASIINFVNFFIQDELTENPTNRILSYISQSTANLAGSSKVFAALYLVSHGIINALIVLALWKQKLWAYPVSMVVLGLFGVFQLYQYTFNHSVWLLILTALDIIILLLVWHEYGVLRKGKGVR